MWLRASQPLLLDATALRAQSSALLPLLNCIYLKTDIWEEFLSKLEDERLVESWIQCRSFC